jgi:hypothetical protein
LSRRKLVCFIALTLGAAPHAGHSAHIALSTLVGGQDRGIRLSRTWLRILPSLDSETFSKHAVTTAVEYHSLAAAAEAGFDR